MHSLCVVAFLSITSRADGRTDRVDPDDIAEFVSPPFVQVALDFWENEEMKLMVQDPNAYDPWGKAGIAYTALYYARNARLAAQYAKNPGSLEWNGKQHNEIWNELFRAEMGVFGTFRGWFDDSKNTALWHEFARTVTVLFNDTVKPIVDYLSDERTAFEVEMPVLKSNGLGAKYLDDAKSSVAIASNVEFDKDKPFIPTLDDGFPLIGFGSWPLTGDRCKQAVLKALRTGYRLIDTSENYNNEIVIGEAIRESGVDRSEIMIASKVSRNENYGRGPTRKAFEESLRLLGVDYIDVYMTHGAIGDKRRLREAWLDLEELYNEKKIRYLGVSNYSPRDMAELMGYAEVKPSFIQNKFDPFTQGQQSPWGQPIEEWVIHYNEHQKAAEDPPMIVQAYCVLNSWPHKVRAVLDKHVQWIADKYGVTSAQLLIRWALQHAYVGVLTRSEDETRQLQNLNVFDFEINNVDMQLLNGLNTLLSPFDVQWTNDVYGQVSNRPQADRHQEL